MTPRFSCLKLQGIENLQQLQTALKTKVAVQSFAAWTGLSIEYLTILRREVNSYQPKPIKLGEFPGINPEVLEKLEQAGIKNTKQIFPFILTPERRKALAEEQQIEPADLLELTKLTDVGRLKWVGPKFARLLIESEYDTVEKIAGADFEELFNNLVHVNEAKAIYKGKFGKADLKMWVNVVVQETPQVIQY